ncbi:hypothetical protein QJS66_08020 [Kocuria rhizophila]|nr:hypothetical protein QJS66_08020 [Kocuria rhizophila]
MLDQPQDLAAAVARVREHPGWSRSPSVRTARPDGSRVRRQAAEQLRAAGRTRRRGRPLRPWTRTCRDEGVLAEVDDAWRAPGWAPDARARPRRGSHRGRQRRQRLDMLAALAEAASTRGGPPHRPENATAVEEVVMLLALLDREFEQGAWTCELRGRHLHGVGRLHSAYGQSDDDAWHCVRRAATPAQVVVPGDHCGGGRW